MYVCVCACAQKPNSSKALNSNLEDQTSEKETSITNSISTACTLNLKP